MIPVLGFYLNFDVNGEVYNIVYIFLFSPFSFSGVMTFNYVYALHGVGGFISRRFLDDIIVLLVRRTRNCTNF